jgi:TMEM175 potassium channel family protein
MNSKQEEKESTRIEAFSDGVFAIAITLLVLGIKVPSHESVVDHGLASSLTALWPSFLAFFISFITVLVIWVQHHWVFTYVRRVDHRLLYWNGLLLLVVTFVPFPTGLLSEHLTHADATLAANLYTGNLLVISIVFLGLWRHVVKSGKPLSANLTSSKQGEERRIDKYLHIAPLLYLAAFGLSFISEIVGVSTCILLAFVLSLPDWFKRIV